MNASTTEKPRILIVDDSPENLHVLTGILKEKYALIPALNGKKALDLANRTPAPDLILLDVMMPGIDGFEVCKRLKTSPQTADIPVLFITALHDPQNEARALEVGGVDFITKPIQPLVVRARVKTHLALRNAYRELEERHEEMRWERELIEEILLTMRTPLKREPHVRYLLTPVERTAGDLFLMERRPDGFLHALIGDCTGHGLPAAIVGPMVMDIFIAMTRKGFSPEEILAEINHKLYRRIPPNLFMAACFVEHAPAGDGIRLWNHGMPDALLWHDGTWAMEWPSIYSPLGIVADLPPLSVPPVRLLRENDRLVVYSDGLVEAHAPDGEMFGLERWKDSLEQIFRTGEPLDSILTILNSFRGSDITEDDITVVEFLTMAPTGGSND